MRELESLELHVEARIEVPVILRMKFRFLPMEDKDNCSELELQDRLKNAIP